MFDTIYSLIAATLKGMTSSGTKKTVKVDDEGHALLAKDMTNTQFVNGTQAIGVGATTITLDTPDYTLYDTYNAVAVRLTFSGNPNRTVIINHVLSGIITSLPLAGNMVLTVPFLNYETTTQQGAILFSGASIGVEFLAGNAVTLTWEIVYDNLGNVVVP